jgi:hypothetical protein
MPYLVASILTIVAALTILLTRYEADDSTIKAEIANMKVMFSMVDGFVNTYVDSGGNLTNINFQKLNDTGILFNVGVTANSTILTAAVPNTSVSTIRLPSSDVIWHLIPNPDDTTSYKLLVDIRGNSGLMSKAIFSESFIGKEFCEKSLFGTFERTRISFDGTDDFTGTGTNSDGLFVCVVYK